MELESTVRTLYLLRHAKSSWAESGLSDHQRPLNTRGRKAARAIGCYLRDRDVIPSVVLCSSAVRTRQTLDYVLGELASEPEILVEEALYGASAGQLLERLRQLDDRYASALLIGHNPGVAQLALSLASQQGRTAQRIARKYPTAGLAEFEVRDAQWSALAPGQAQLVGFTTGRELTSPD